MTPLSTQRLEKAVLGTLETYDGVPLSAADVADETGLEIVTTSQVLTRLYSRYVVQRSVQNNVREKPVFMYWLGMPRL